MPPTSQQNELGIYLRNRREKLDPASAGVTAERRRTPGLRREEVAQRANVSVTWYTWLEQGRGGAPSADVLERLARALSLSGDERQHLFLLAQYRPPEVNYQPFEPAPQQLQRMIDGMQYSPALVRTPLWDVIAWNKAASAVLTDYAALDPQERNILKLIFLDARVRSRMVDWEKDARNAVAAFRVETARAGASKAADLLVEELSRSSPEFDAIWRDYDIQSFGQGTKHLRHETAGDMMLEYSSLAVDGRPDLNIVIFTPRSDEDTDRIRSLVNRH